MNRLKNITSPLVWSLALLLTTVVAGCGSGSTALPTPDTTLPTVTSIAPLNAASGVPINTNITATFSEAMKASTITMATFTLNLGASSVPASSVDGTVNYVGTSASFNPTIELAASSVYTATISTGAQDAAGNALASNKVWSFTTGGASDTLAPTVSSITPLNAESGVPLNRDVTANFSEVMDATTITSSNFTLNPGASSVPASAIAGTVTYSGTTATFNPTSNLAASAVYTATVVSAASGVKDLAGNALASNKVWSFTTGTSVTTSPAAINLLTAGDFVILANTAVTYNGTAGASAVTGDVGISPGFSTAIIGFSSYALDATNDFATVSEVVSPGKLYAPDYTGVPLGSGPTPAKMTAAQNDNVTAYNDAAGRTPGVGATNLNLGAGTLTGLTLGPGTYTWDAGTPGGNVSITGNITLTGSATDVWIFQISGTLTQATATSIILGGTAKAKNIFWQVAGGVALNGTAHMEGVIMSATAITLNAGSSANSRLLAQSAVTLGGTVTQPTP